VPSDKELKHKVLKLVDLQPPALARRSFPSAALVLLCITLAVALSVLLVVPLPVLLVISLSGLSSVQSVGKLNMNSPAVDVLLLLLLINADTSQWNVADVSQSDDDLLLLR